MLLVRRRCSVGAGRRRDCAPFIRTVVCSAIRQAASPRRSPGLKLELETQFSIQCAMTTYDSQATPTDHSPSFSRDRDSSSQWKATNTQREQTPFEKHIPESSNRVNRDLEELRKKMGSHSGGSVVLLGIESSYDESAAAVVDEKGQILGEAVLQMTERLKTGGIARRPSAFHRENLDRVTTEALRQSGRSLKEVAGIAVSVCPGLYLCLREGISHAQKLAQEAKKPILPVHRLAAHALTPRMENNIPFPYLVLLCSGGHCILAIVHNNRHFTVLGRCLDDNPGEALDQCARMMRLDLHPDLQGLSGGAAIEKLAEKGDPNAISLIKGRAIMEFNMSCNFSFTGLREAVKRVVDNTAAQGWDRESPLPMCEDVAAAFQAKLVDHLVQRTHRATGFLARRHFDINSLVVSGGVACNSYLRLRLEHLTKHYNYRLFAPPPRLCTDNGVMVAWAGLERLQEGSVPVMTWNVQEGAGPLGVCWSEWEQTLLEPLPKASLGEDLTGEVEAAKIKVRMEYWKRGKNTYFRKRRQNEFVSYDHSVH